jgi:uncharacterized protein YxeA
MKKIWWILIVLAILVVAGLIITKQIFVNTTNNVIP